MRRSIFIVSALILSVGTGFGAYLYDSDLHEIAGPAQQNLPEFLDTTKQAGVLGTTTETTEPQVSATTYSPAPKKRTPPSSPTGAALTAKQVQHSLPPLIENCNANYVPCVPQLEGMVTCEDIGFAITIKGEDVFSLDPDGDLSACEEYLHSPELDEDPVVVPLPSPVSNTGPMSCTNTSITCEGYSFLISL